MRTRNLMLSLLAAAVLASGGFNSASAQIEEATVKLDGLACPFCAYGLEKKLKKVEGVEKLKIHVKKGTAKLAVKKGRAISIEAVEKAVKDGGFTPREISITVAGRLVERNGQTLLTIPNSEDIFLVDLNEQLKKVREILKGEDKTVRLIGKVARKKEKGHTGHPYVLSIESF